MKNEFNLIDEPWIPCINADNEGVKVGLYAAIQQAHQLKQIAGELPTIKGALHLLLLAFATSIYQPKDLDDWERLHQQGKFDDDILKSYCDAWHDRFFLFSEEHTFYQDPKIGTRPKDITNLGNDNKPISKGFTGHLLHYSSGSNATLFDHTLDSDEKFFSPDEAARLLVMIQAYSLGGMGTTSIGKEKFFKDSPFSRGISFLCRGENLFEMLMRNMIPKNQDLLLGENEDQPCWERDDPFVEERSIPLGVKDLLTWQSRRIHLVAEQQDDQTGVKVCYSAPGLPITETFANPFYLNDHEIVGSKLQIRPMRFQNNRIVWRDSAVILDSKRSKADKPITRGLFERLISEQVISDTTISLSLFGMCTEPGQKKVYQYREELFDAPVEYIEKPDLHQKLQAGLQLAEAIRTALYFATYELASNKAYPEQDTQEGLKPDKDMVKKIIESIGQESHFWAQLETPFYELMRQLPSDQTAYDSWKKRTVEVARECLQLAGEKCGEDYVSIKAQAKGRNRLDYEISKIINPKPKEV